MVTRKNGRKEGISWALSVREMTLHVTELQNIHTIIIDGDDISRKSQFSSTFTYIDF